MKEFQSFANVSKKNGILSLCHLIFLLEECISSLSPFLIHKTHPFQGLAGPETPYRHDTEPSERSASSPAQVLVSTAANDMPLAEVVAAVKHHADMAARRPLMTEKASDKHPLHRFGDVA